MWTCVCVRETKKRGGVRVGRQAQARTGQGGVDEGVVHELGRNLAHQDDKVDAVLEVSAKVCDRLVVASLAQVVVEPPLQNLEQSKTRRAKLGRGARDETDRAWVWSRIEPRRPTSPSASRGTRPSSADASAQGG